MPPAPWLLRALRVHPVRWRELWALDGRQPAMPAGLRGQHLYAVDIPARRLDTARLLISSSASQLPDGCRLVGGYVPVLRAGGRRVRLVFALNVEVAL